TLSSGSLTTDSFVRETTHSASARSNPKSSLMSSDLMTRASFGFRVVCRSSCKRWSEMTMSKWPSKKASRMAKQLRPDNNMLMKILVSRTTLGMQRFARFFDVVQDLFFRNGVFSQTLLKFREQAVPALAASFTLQPAKQFGFIFRTQLFNQTLK